MTTAWCGRSTTYVRTVSRCVLRIGGCRDRPGRLLSRARLYIAHRNNGILQEQLAIREKYNESLEKEVNKYLSQEGIEEAAREQGMGDAGRDPHYRAGR